MNVNPITPLTVFKALRNVPFDNSYTDTINFGSQSAQQSFFNGKVKYSFQDLTTVRMQYNTVKLPRKADDFFDCNYVMFQNKNFGTKWFYGFITEINYLTPNTTEIKFEIDAIQTWWFDININESMILREHVNNDYTGWGEARYNTIVPEPLEFVEYVDKELWSEVYTDLQPVVATTQGQLPGRSGTGGKFGGLYSGVNYFGGTYGEIEDLLAAIVNNGQEGTIASTFLMPKEFFTYDEDLKRETFTISNRQNAIDGYIPRNGKLYMYPFNYLFVTSPNGQERHYRWEYFKTGTVGFRTACAMSCNPEVLLYPVQYEADSEFTQEMSITGFPQFTYPIDTFKAWCAQNGSSMALSAVGNGLSLAAGAVSGNPFMVANGAMGFASDINSAVVASKQSDRIGGTPATNNTKTADNKMGFFFYQRHLRKDVLARYDDYFDRFGYAVNLLKRPNVSGRESWNYVLTQDCNITGSVPFNDITKIKDAFNKGITFWHGDYVGNYSRSNNITG